MDSLVVIGGASLDTLHLRDRTVRSAGGAGLYTALAAHRAGVEVTMVGPVPEPMPGELVAAAACIDWRGEQVPPEQLPSFEIAHYEEDSSKILHYAWRAEGRLHPERLPQRLIGNLVYCGPLCDPDLQLEFVRHFHHLGWRIACGTFEEAVLNHADIVREILALADIFFCNRSEAETIFGDLARVSIAPGTVLFITQGRNGVRVVQGDWSTDVPAVSASAIDPTGAGDTLCGTVLARLLLGEHPVEAARHGVEAAALSIASVASVLDHNPEASSFAFTGGDYPPVGHALALDFFFTSTLQLFGFWHDDGDAYTEPMVASIDGRMLKGSDYLWAAYRRWLEEDPRGLEPQFQSTLEHRSFDHRMRDDKGVNPLPVAELHYQSARSYGADMVGLEETPRSILDRSNRSSRPLRTFLEQLDHIGGYKEDPLRKKSALLAAILRARPEQFLTWGDEDELPPIIDYHLQRSCLRIGLVDIEDPALRERVAARRFVSSAQERRIRETAFEALLRMRDAAHKTMADLDWFFFQNRQRCPEMTEPLCDRCPIDDVCAQRKDLFQPVIRTTFY
ncbi:MAG: PfkB family carbohydrate kinase [Acidobacteriota bacterium]